MNNTLKRRLMIGKAMLPVLIKFKKNLIQVKCSFRRKLIGYILSWN